MPLERDSNVDRSAAGHLRSTRSPVGADRSSRRWPWCTAADHDRAVDAHGRRGRSDGTTLSAIAAHADAIVLAIGVVATLLALALGASRTCDGFALRPATTVAVLRAVAVVGFVAAGLLALACRRRRTTRLLALVAGGALAYSTNQLLAAAHPPCGDS